MARLHGKDVSAFTWDSKDFLDDLISIDFKASAQMHDTTTLGDDWIEYTAGLKGGDDCSLEMFWDDGVDGPYDYFADRIGGAAASMVITLTNAARIITVNTIVKEVSLPISVGDMMKHTVTLALTGAVTFA